MRAWISINWIISCNQPLLKIKRTLKFNCKIKVSIFLFKVSQKLVHFLVRIEMKESKHKKTKIFCWENMKMKGIVNWHLNRRNNINQRKTWKMNIGRKAAKKLKINTYVVGHIYITNRRLMKCRIRQHHTFILHSPWKGRKMMK